MDEIRDGDERLHVVLYAKGRYERGDVMEDLKRIFGCWSCCDPDVYTDASVVRLVSDLWFSLLDGTFRRRDNWFPELFYIKTDRRGEYRNPTPEDLVSQMLGDFTVMRVDELPKLPAPSDEVLPIKYHDPYE